MGRLDGKIALITGGTTGIGLATAKLFVAEGARVIVTGRNQETLAQAKEMLGSGVDVIAADAADLEQITTLFAQVKERHHRIDALFVNAGVAQFAPAEQVTPEFFDYQFNINVRGVFFTVKEAIPLLSDGGAVLLTSSIAAGAGMATTSIYAASKAAVRSFGRTLAAELAPRRIRVNTISPGPIETPIFDKLGLSAEQVAGFSSSMTEGNPLKRFGRPEEVAQAALFLLSDASSYTTGSELFVDGGAGEL